MKNAVLSGLIVGILSVAWIFAMPHFGIAPNKDTVAPIEYFSFLIPALGLLFGIWSYRQTDCNGQMGFLEALVQSFKILIVGGIVTVFGAIIFVSYISPGGNHVSDFSGRIFGAMLVGVLLAFAVSLLFMNKANKID